MSNLNPIAKFIFALPVAGGLAAILSAAALGAFSIFRDQPPWMPLNATSHVLHGPAAAEVIDVTWSHTALGAIIHIGSAFFWAAIAIALFRAVGSAGRGAAWVAGLGTAALAAAVDYGLMPSRLTPGWELVLPSFGVIAGFVALGVGIAFSLDLAQRRQAATAAGSGQSANSTPEGAAAPRPELERMRRPTPTELDQRQQRIDPAGLVTADLNWRDDRNRKQPGGSARSKEEGD